MLALHNDSSETLRVCKFSFLSTKQEHEGHNQNAIRKEFTKAKTNKKAFFYIIRKCKTDKIDATKIVSYGINNWFHASGELYS